MGYKYFLFASFIVCCFCSCSQSYYYGINSYGKLTLSNNNKYYLDYFDNDQDTGSYSIIGDTLFLKTNSVPVKFSKIHPDSLIQPNGFDIPIKVYQSGCLILDTVATFDTLQDCVFIDLALQEGYLLSFQFLHCIYSIVLDNDISGKYWFKLDMDFKRKLYFSNYPLLIRDRYLLPFDREANEYYKRINSFEFLPMKKGTKNTKYKTYLSGFGKIH
jgi:hypothetical protein